MSFVPIPTTPRWALTAAREHSVNLQRAAAEGFRLLELLGAALGAMALGAAVLAALPSNDRDDRTRP
jgi:hypothetical protein